MSEQSMTDQRRFHRIFYKASAILSSDEQTWLCEISDLSLNGCLLSFVNEWHGDTDKTYTLTLCLSEEVQITMSLSVSHAVDKLVGFKCQHIDIDSISELRRLVELNLGDSSLLERDLNSLAF